MKSYIIINGTDSMIIKKSSLDDAKKFAIMYCNHSEEIIVRRIDVLRKKTNSKLGNILINLN
jgi:hypothetical protein